ncbi:hypothetical protein Tco_0708292 [Tanacetum coccineum]
MLTGPEKTGRVAKWAIELGEHDIVFLRRNKKETLVDFLVEIPFEDNKKKEKSKEAPDSNSEWRLYTDGASNLDRPGARLMLIDPKGLQIAQEMEIAKVAIFLDSQLLEPKQESRRAKQAGINDLRTSHKRSASRSFDQKVNRGKYVLKADIQERKSWMDPIHEYLLRGLLLEDRKEARRIRIQVPQYKLIQGKLYKRSFFTSWLRCMAPL